MFYLPIDTESRLLVHDKCVESFDFPDELRLELISDEEAKKTPVLLCNCSPQVPVMKVNFDG